MESSRQQEQRVEALQTEVAVLQKKLHDLHATDVNTLRRGYITVSQHVHALKLEASRLEQLVDELEPELYPPEYVAEELGKAAVVSGAVYGIFKLVKTIAPLPAKATSWLRGGLVAVTAFVVTWRFASSSIGRFAASLLAHNRRRKACLKEIAALQERIDILHALTTSMPGVQQQLQGSSSEAAAATAAVAAGKVPAGGPTAASAGGTGGTEGGGLREQFVVVDLPRVESGGFILQSPTVSSPAPPELLGLPGSAAAVDRQALSSIVQQLGFTAAGGGPGPIATEVSGAAGAGSSSSRPAVPAAAAVRQPLPAATQQLLQQRAQQQLAAVVPVRAQQQGSGQVDAGSTSSAAHQQPGTSAFSVPSSVLMSGWGGVVMQQERALHPVLLMQQQQQPGVAGASQSTAEAAAVRQFSSDTDAEEGEWVEQASASSIGDPEAAVLSGNNGSSTAGGSAAGPGGAGGSSAAAEQQGGSSVGQQGDVSPASSSSDDAVLLERE